MPGELYKTTVSNTVRMLISSGMVFIIQFITTIILARVYSPEEFGILSKITIITSFADVFCQLGLGAAIVQKKECNERDYKTVAISSILLGLITSAAIFFFSVPISELVKIDNHAYLKFIAPAFLIISLSVLPIARLQRDMRFNIIVEKDIVSYLCYALLCVIMGALGFGLTGLIIGLLGRYLVSTMIVIFRGKYSLAMKYDHTAFKSMFRFGTGFSLCKICSVAADQSDYYGIARTLSNYDLGLYNKAFQLISTPISLIGQGIDQVFFSSFSKIQDDDVRIRDLFVSVSAITSLVSSVTTVCLFYCSGLIIKVLFGIEWIEASVPISILSLAVFSRASIKITDPIMRAKGYVYPRAFFHSLNAILTIAAALIGSSYGLLGVSIGVATAQFINYFINFFYISYKIKINIVRYMRSTALIIATSIAVCLWGILSSAMNSIWAGIYDRYSLILITAVCVIITASCFLTYKYLFDKQTKSEVIRFISTIKSITRNKRQEK